MNQCRAWTACIFMMAALLSAGPASAAVFTETEDIMCAEESSAAERQPVIVCVLDSGCNWDNVQGISLMAEKDDLTDETGHGTEMMDLIQEAAPDAELYMIKCFEKETCTPEVLADAVYAAVDKYHADVISMSWTGTQENKELYQAIQYAAEEGCVLIASAGNSSLTQPLGSIVYPAGWVTT